MFAENVFPPIPSELIMPLAGFLAYQDQMNFVGVVIAGSIGSLAGTYLYYIIARKIGHDRVRHLLEKHGRWLTMSPEDLDRASDWFDRHGNLAVLMGRMVPAIRTVIWNTLLTGLGYALGSQYDLVADYMNPVSNVVIGALVLTYIYRVIRKKGGSAQDATG